MKTYKKRCADTFAEWYGYHNFSEFMEDLVEELNKEENETRLLRTT